MQLEKLEIAPPKVSTGAIGEMLMLREKIVEGLTLRCLTQPGLFKKVLSTRSMMACRYVAIFISRAAKAFFQRSSRSTGAGGNRVVREVIDTGAHILRRVDMSSFPSPIAFHAPA